MLKNENKKRKRRKLNNLPAGLVHGGSIIPDFPSVFESPRRSEHSSTGSVP